MPYIRLLITCLLFASGAAATAQSTTTSFHYAGTLTDTQAPVPNGNYDIRVRLYDGPSAGANQLGGDVLLSPVAVTLGFFSIDVDFGVTILAPQSWLEFAVQPTGGSAFQTLSPRQEVGHVPLALYSEGTDWSGIANLPAEIQALTNATPPAIGSIATTPVLAGAASGPNQIAVRRVQFGITRLVSLAPPAVGEAAPDPVELWLEPTLAFPSIVNAVNRSTALTNLTLNLNFANTTSNTIALFTNVTFTFAELEPARDASGTTLAHVKFSYGTVKVTAPNSLSYTYDFINSTGTPTTMPAICPAFLSTLGYGSVPADFSGAGLITLSQPDVFSTSKPLSGGGGGGGGGVKPVFALPEISVALTSGTATASTSLVVCALALVTSNQSLNPAPTLSLYPAGAANATSWSTQTSWGGVYVSAFGLNSDLSGNVRQSFEFTPTTSYSVTTQNAAKTKTVTSCWNLNTNAPC